MISGRDRTRVLILFCLAVAAGLGVSAAYTLGPAWDGPGGTAADAPNVVVIVANNLRADHLPCNGYARNTTPNICRFADNSVRFTDAVTQSVWTLPSTVSLFTSQYPSVHGVRSEDARISGSATTLTEVFSRNGYATGAFVGNRRCRGGHLKSRYGFAQGFDSYNERGPWFNTSVPRAIEWLRGRDSEPFFLFVHGYDPHDPYGDTSGERRFMKGYDGVLTDYILQWRPEDDRRILDDIELNGSEYVLNLTDATIPLTEQDLAYIRAQYDTDLAAADQEIGRLLAYLRRTGRYDDTIIVVTANHGEMLGERIGGRRRWVHSFPYDPVTTVPLFVHAPGITDRTTGTTIELIDVFPTLVDLAGLPATADAQIQGTSFGPVLKRGADAPDAYAFSRGTGSTESVQNRTWKYIETRNADYPEGALYFRRDGESFARVATPDVPARVAADLARRLDRWRATNRAYPESSAPVGENPC